MRLLFKSLALGLIFKLLRYVPRTASFAMHFLLRKAIDKGYTRLVRYICYLPIDFNHNHKGVTLLQYAFKSGNLDIIREFLKNRAVQATIFAYQKNSRFNEQMDRWGLDAILMMLTSPQFKITTFSLPFVLTPAKLQAIAQVLINPNCKVRMLGLACNNLTDADMEILVKVLINPNCKIENISLGFNNITDVGAAMLADAIRNPNCKLKHLDLRANTAITDNGVINIINAIGITNKMTSLAVPTGVAMTKEGMKHCLDLIARNFKSSITTFYIPLYSLNDDEQAEVIEHAPTKTQQTLWLLNAARELRIRSSALRHLPVEVIRLAGEMVEDKRSRIQLRPNN